MRTLRRLMAIFIATTCPLMACSSNDGATSKCAETTSSGACLSCCHDNGALGYEWSGKGPCKCLN